MKASNSMSELTSASEQALSLLDCVFAKNESEGLVEYEVARPFEFLVRIEELSKDRDTGIRLVMFNREETGRTFVVVAPPSSEGSVRLASSFVREVLRHLRKKPWQGLGLVRSKTAEILWERWANMDGKGARAG